MEGQGQRSSASRGLGAETAETASGDMDVAEALEASADSAACASLRVDSEEWATWSKSRRDNWHKTKKRKQKKGSPGPAGGFTATGPQAR